ncbi:MAG TPA: hypothetical protein VGM72_12745 [Micropepsaceae bacterium]|jgi:hypothetical protein
MKIGGNNSDFRARRALRAPRIVEKPDSVSRLSEENLRETAQTAIRTERRSVARASRFGTYYAGGVDRRGMQARFVAQVLGQILDSGDGIALIARRAYAQSSRERKETRLVRVL